MALAVGAPAMLLTLLCLAPTAHAATLNNSDFFSRTSVRQKPRLAQLVSLIKLSASCILMGKLRRNPPLSSFRQQVESTPLWSQA